MKGKRLVAAIFAVALVACFAVGTAGCADENEGVVPKKEYEVTIVNGESVSTAKYEDGYRLELEELEKDGFEFLGYYADGTKVESPYTVTSDAVLTAVYRYGALGENLTNALKAYLGSETFEKSISGAKTAAAWLPLAYLRYVDGEFYTVSNSATFKKYLNMLPQLIGDDGEIKDVRWNGSDAQKQGWYGITDYLYTYAIALNAYKEYLNGKGLVDNSFDVYNQAIGNYLEKLCNWLSHNTDKYDILGEEVTQANFNNVWGNVWRNGTVDERYLKMASEKAEALLKCVALATGSDEGHAEFLEKYRKGEEQVAAITEERERIKPETDALYEQFKAGDMEYPEYFEKKQEAETTLNVLIDNLKGYCDKNGIDENSLAGLMPVTRVAFGMSATAYIAVVKANLGLDADITYVDESIKSRYEKDENGNFVKEGGTPNWVGPTGTPIAASLYRDMDWYDVDFEKCRQGYFPFTDGWNQPLSEMITLDLYGKYYNHTLTTGANVAPQWGLLTGYMHGIDMENYEVAQPVEGEPSTYNVISLWLDNLKLDGDGNYIIEGNLDMAVAISYLAYINGVEAPTPLGMYDYADKVIKL